MAKRRDNEETVIAAYTPGQEQQRVREIQQYVELHMAQEKLAQCVASHVQMDDDSLSSLMENTFGQSLHDYILQERMRLAQRMLLESSASISSIASALGYSSSSSFSNVFRKQLSMAPNVFRKTAPMEKLTTARGMLHWG